jgi:RecB family exonuclease
MTNTIWAHSEVSAPARRPDPEAVAAHVLAGESPFDFVGRPEWFSFSAFDMFERCPRQYAFGYLCRLPAERPRPAAEFGSAAHAAFEAFTRERRERSTRGEGPPERADLEHYFEAAWAAGPLPAEPDAAAWRLRAEPMLDRFWAAEAAEPSETLGEELRFRLRLAVDEMATVVVIGYVDRVDRLASGAVELIDYKTGSPGRPADAESSLQLSIYALGSRDVLGLGRPERVTLRYVEHDLLLCGERTDAALDAVRVDLAVRARRIRTGGFDPTPSPRACGWCDFAARCPVGIGI